MKDKLRTFERFPDTSICPVCGTNEDKECVLISIYGTEEGNICKAQPFHTGCLQLIYYEDDQIIAQKL